MGINVQDKREAQITDIDILCECRREDASTSSITLQNKNLFP